MTRPAAERVEDWKPFEIARLVEGSGVAKARLGTGQTLALGVLAGAFIGFGAAFYTVVMTGTDPGFGPARLLGGVAFALGLILVIVAGAELFTGNALMMIAAIDGKITTRELFRNWTLVYIGNAVGATGLALAFWLAGLSEGATGARAVAIAEGKLALGPVELFFRAVLCNILVCLAVWLAMAARNVPGKILAVLWPVTAFVALGLEHSIASLFLLPQGALAGGNVPLGAAAANIALATLGNILGGAGGVALAYRLIWGKPA